MKRVVLAGAGHAHIEVLRAFAMQRPDCELVVVSPYPWLSYSGMLPGFVAGHYTLEQCTVDVAMLCERADARLILATVVSLDASRREITCSDGSRIAYDVLSLDVGSRPMIEAAAGVEQHAVVVRPLERLVKGWTGVLAAAREGRVHSVTLVGTGAAGLELAFAMHHRLKAEMGEARPHLRIVGDSAVPVPEFSGGARRRLQAEIHHRRIESHHGSGVVEVGDGFVRLRNGLEFATDAVFWTAGSASHPWIAGAGFATDARGYLLTSDLLQSVSHPEVLGAGDCATEQGHRVAKAGVFAVRAGPALAHNIRARVDERPLRAHLTSRRYLALISAGDRYAIGVWGGFSWEGEWVWRWKDRIDRAFVAKYKQLGSDSN